LLRHIKDVVDKYSSEPSYDPKRVYDEMVDVCDEEIRPLMYDLLTTLDSKEVK
tara:strand:- start:398 stop:556 length:159 start_codon:yes stop_codon:yes gene_type:complete